MVTLSLDAGIVFEALVPAMASIIAERDATRKALQQYMLRTELEAKETNDKWIKEFERTDREIKERDRRIARLLNKIDELEQTKGTA